MTATFKPATGTHTAVTTSGGSTSNNAGVLGTNVIANSTNLDSGLRLLLVVGFGSSPAVGVTIACYLIPKIDGTNFPDTDTSSTPPNSAAAFLIGSFVVAKAQTATQKIGLDIPVGALKAVDYEVYLVNLTGQTMSSGWTLDAYGDALQSV